MKFDDHHSMRAAQPSGSEACYQAPGAGEMCLQLVTRVTGDPWKNTPPPAELAIILAKYCR